MNKQNQLAEIHNSGKPYIIYKSKKGFNLFTNFSKKIVLNNNNIKKFLEKKYKSKRKKTDLYIGFFVCGFHITLVGTHVPKYVIDRGLENWTAAAILSLIGLFNIFGSLLSG